MAVVLLTTLSWLFSIFAVLGAFLAPIMLKVIPSPQILRLLFLTYLFQVVILPALVWIWYSNTKDAKARAKRRSSLVNAPPSEEETTALLTESSSPRDAGSSLRNRRNSDRTPVTASFPLVPQDEPTFWQFLAQRKLRAVALLMTILANTVLFGLCLDFVFRPFLFAKHHDLEMTRVGGIGPDYAKIFVRIPRDINVRLEQRPAKKGVAKWTICEGPIEVREAHDFTAVGTCSGLRDGTTYAYRWTDETGNTLLDSSEWDYLRFTTAPPSLTPSKYSFAFTSCVKPGFPYGTKGVRGFREMGKQDLSFVMFLGDLIYADAPWMYGSDVSTYRWHYRYLYSHEDFRHTFRRLPFLTIYDDHEISNDWESSHEAPYPAAFKAFNEYAGGTNPHIDTNSSAVFEYEFGDTAFFVMDTRVDRNWKERTMLGATQKARLKKWLLEVKSSHTVKFLVTSVPFTQNWQWQQRDTWAGYLKERQEILDFISTNDIRNVLAISGDRHEVAITRLPGNVIEFSTSPLQAFYSPIDTYVETAEDQVIFSWRPGNIKWGMFTIDTQRPIPTATYALFVNDFQDTPVYEKTFELERI